MNVGVGVLEGTYTVIKGDTPRTIASVAYGDGNQYAKLLTANPGIDWQPGDIVTVPDKKGRFTLVEAGENIVDVLKRLFPNQPTHLYTSRFLLWNGETADLEEGQRVFVPER